MNTVMRTFNIASAVTALFIAFASINMSYAEEPVYYASADTGTVGVEEHYKDLKVVSISTTSNGLVTIELKNANNTHIRVQSGPGAPAVLAITPAQADELKRAQSANLLVDVKFHTGGGATIVVHP